MIDFWSAVLEAWIKENPDETVYRVPDGFMRIESLNSETICKSKIKKIILPPSISWCGTLDGHYCFDNFTLDELEFEDGGTELTIYASAFKMADIRKIILPKTTPIYLYPYSFCSAKIEEITIPENTIIKDGKEIFWCCRKLKKCSIECKTEPHVRTTRMFEGCTSLSEIKLSEGFKIGTSTFNDCTSLDLKTIKRRKTRGDKK